MIDKEVLELVLSKSSIVFDMDGTIINTEPLHEKGLKTLLKKLEIQFNFKEDEFVGLPDSEVFELIPELKNKLSPSDFIEEKNIILVELIQQTDLTPYLNEGILNFLELLKKNNKEISLVTASEDDVAKTTIREAKIADYFDHIITREKTFRSKPSCSPYLFLLRQIKRETKDIIVFEDSIPGINSALEANIKVIGVKSFTQNNSPVLKIKNFNFSF